MLIMIHEFSAKIYTFNKILIFASSGPGAEKPAASSGFLPYYT